MGGIVERQDHEAPVRGRDLGKATVRNVEAKDVGRRDTEYLREHAVDRGPVADDEHVLASMPGRDGPDRRDRALPHHLGVFAPRGMPGRVLIAHLLELLGMVPPDGRFALHLPLAVEDLAQRRVHLERNGAAVQNDRGRLDRSGEVAGVGGGDRNIAQSAAEGARLFAPELGERRFRLAAEEAALVRLRLAVARDPDTGVGLRGGHLRRRLTRRAKQRRRGGI